jgi:hypothetical protein
VPLWRILIRRIRRRDPRNVRAGREPLVGSMDRHRKPQMRSLGFQNSVDGLRVDTSGGRPLLTGNRSEASRRPDPRATASVGDRE